MINNIKNNFKEAITQLLYDQENNLLISGDSNGRISKKN